MSGKNQLYKRVIPTLGMVFLLSACSATVNWNYPRVASNALEHPETTSVGAFFKDAADKHPGLSGFSLLLEGRDAFVARLAMADLAEKTLDVQYYIWDADIIGRLLARRLVRAADRGVRVRVLLDDNYETEEKDSTIAALAAHPNIEIRVFNPVANRYWRTLSFLGDFARANHRMHNKQFVVDNALGVIGGRNIGDIYFGVRSDRNYRDLDIATSGPVVKELSASFDRFWNSEWAIPINATVEEVPTEQDLRAIMKHLDDNIANAGFPYPVYDNPTEIRAQAVRIRDQFIWAPGRFLVEDPSRAATDSDPGTAYGVIGAELVKQLDSVEHEVSIESPYFITRKRGFELVRQLKARGIKIRILTNSAASNDVFEAHVGYANTRKELLKLGVELYELRPDSDMKRHWSFLSGKSRAALHNKAFVFDRKSVFIGSFNLDPRSLAINTEGGVLIDSPEIAERVGKFMDEGAAPGSAFHVTLDDNDDLVWTAENNGEKVEFDTDPEISIWGRLGFALLSILPIENQL